MLDDAFLLEPHNLCNVAGGCMVDDVFDERAVVVSPDLGAFAL